MKYLLTILFVVFGVTIANALAALFGVETYEVYGPLAFGAVIALAVDIYSKGSD